jgi:hypothetical protein
MPGQGHAGRLSNFQGVEAIFDVAAPTVEDVVLTLGLALNLKFRSAS